LIAVLLYQYRDECEQLQEAQRAASGYIFRNAGENMTGHKIHLGECFLAQGNGNTGLRHLGPAHQQRSGQAVSARYCIKGEGESHFIYFGRY